MLTNLHETIYFLLNSVIILDNEMEEEGIEMKYSNCIFRFKINTVALSPSYNDSYIS